MRRYDLEINGKSFTVGVREFTAERAELEIDGALYTVNVGDVVTEGLTRSREAPVQPTRRLAAGPEAKPAAGSPEGTVTAPIPGQVLELKVDEGDEVTVGQPLVVMEAMKMENVIAAHTAGTVGKILVNTGDAVAQGEELLVIV